MVPEGIGEQRKPRQQDGKRLRVQWCDGRSLTGAALGVGLLRAGLLRAGLLRAAKTRPPHEVRALLLSRIDPLQESAHLCQAQGETGGLISAFFQGR